MQRMTITDVALEVQYRGSPVPLISLQITFFFPFGVMLKTLYTAGDVIQCLNVANSLRLHLR
jgi:hypothetical protein